MKRFLKRLMVFGLVLIISITAFVGFNCFVVGNQYTHSYTAAINDKIDRLCTVTSPKIVLVGNSNLSFGIDSKMIEEAFEMPVINLGLHGGLGNAFHEEMVKLDIDPGDWIIACPSGFDDEDNISDPVLAWTAIEYNWNLWQIPRLKDWRQLIRAYPTYAFKSLARWLRDADKEEAPPYTRSAYNHYGDIVQKPGGHSYQFESVEAKLIGEGFCNRINDLNKYIVDRGASFAVAAYPIGSGEFTADIEDFVAFQLELEQRLDCEVISDYTDYLIPYEYFYNTHLHLTEEGTKLRTEQLIKDIEIWKGIS